MPEKKKMLINVTHAEESRVAIVADGVLEAFEIETYDRKAQKGNIYKGRVESVHPGLQAAFVDIGGARGGFLPLDEVNFKVHPSRKEEGRGRLENHLHKGQEILVQVVRDAYANKPPTLSTYFSLPGRFLVLTPNSDSAGISRKLDDKQRDRLRKIIDNLPIPENHGVIVRTAGAQATKIELARDLKYLLRLWETIQEAAAAVRPPKLIYQERSLVIRAIRDLFTPETEEILVDNAEVCQEIVDFFDMVLPQKKSIVHHYQGEKPIFNKYNLEEQIENIFRRRVPLPSGGAVIFDSTEALTAVDVNSGRNVGEGHVEDTAFKTNLEAAREITRQMRLRDLGGLVVIDFIDMRNNKNVREVEKVVREGLKKDKAHYDLTKISSLGLLEISRERLSAFKSSLRYTDCPLCEGTGSIKTIEAAAMQALRRLQTAVVRGDLENVELTLPPEVAEYLLNAKRHELVTWEERYRTQIAVKGDASFIRDQLEVRTVQRERLPESAPIVTAPSSAEILKAVEEDEAAERAAAATAAERAAAEAAAAAAAAETKPAEGAAPAEGEPGRKKRRRRRGGRKHRKPGEAEAPAPGTEAAESTTEEAEAVEGEEDHELEEGGSETGAEAEGAPSPEGEPSRRKRRRRRRRRKPAAGEAQPAGPETATAEGEVQPAVLTASMGTAEGTGLLPFEIGPQEPRPTAPLGESAAAEALTEPLPLVSPEPPLAAVAAGDLVPAGPGAPRARWWKHLVSAPR